MSVQFDEIFPSFAPPEKTLKVLPPPPWKTGADVPDYFRMSNVFIMFFRFHCRHRVALIVRRETVSVALAKFATVAALSGPLCSFAPSENTGESTRYLSRILDIRNYYSQLLFFETIIRSYYSFPYLLGLKSVTSKLDIRICRPQGNNLCRWWQPSSSSELHYPHTLAIVNNVVP